MSVIKVTVIDDHTLFREGLQGLLERHGIKVLDLVGDAEAGYAVLQKRRPDVVLLDLRLPHSDSMQLLKRLHEEDSSLPVVMLTTSDQEQDLVEALRCGASGYLLKDMEPDALVAALRVIVEEGEVVVAPNLAPALARVVQGHEPKKAVEPEEGLFDSLTPREHEILVLMAEGLSNRGIANSLGISEGTVKAHVKAVLRKLDVASRVVAAVLAVEHGLTTPKPIEDMQIGRDNF